MTKYSLVHIGYELIPLKCSHELDEVIQYAETNLNLTATEIMSLLEGKLLFKYVDLDFYRIRLIQET